jgi:UDP-N-acetylglucosamine 2-epimerase (non-hydrolysing)
MGDMGRRVMVVYGTRPEAIKMAPLIAAFRRDNVVLPIVTVTGQHREMLDQVNDLFGIVPDHDLDLMVPGATLTELASRTLMATGRLIEMVKPDAVVVQGDTSTAFFTALAAFYQGCPVVHLEAGLRSGDMTSPFPEEANRRQTAPVAALHLAPTAQSRVNLLRENIPEPDIAITGNTVIDALHSVLDVPVNFSDVGLATLIANDERFVLVTSHRRESWGQPMRNAMEGLRQAADKHNDVRLVIPMHRNPIVRSVMHDVLGETDNVTLIEPLSYLEFCHAMRHAYLLVTDSGGVQEEGPSLGKPVLVLRDTTERPEAVDAGTVRLVGTDSDAVFWAIAELLEVESVYAAMAGAVNPYGDGLAALRASAAVAEMLGVGHRLPDFMPSRDRRNL